MSHYFDESPPGASAPARVSVRLPDVAFTLRTDRGVFSHGRLDAGTEVLLRHGPPVPPAGTVLDLGCGSGAIAMALARRAPASAVWAVDVNARARQLCAANAADNGLGNVTVAEPGAVPGGLVFDAIWSNPPIRIGKDALHDLLATWFGRLTGTGYAALVVHKHLGADSLHRWLGDHGWPTARLRSVRGYRVLVASPPPP